MTYKKGETKEWREKYPKVMEWEDIPEERRIYPNPQFNERPLEQRKCKKAIDIGNSKERTGYYQKCGMVPKEGENYCHLHGGTKREASKKTPISDKNLHSRITFNLKSINYYQDTLEKLKFNIQIMIRELNKLLEEVEEAEEYNSKELEKLIIRLKKYN